MQVKGYRLHLLLSASQVRRRLKGHGFGVRKVESAGKQESVVIHTATGDHLRQLRSLFQDVLATPPAPPEDAALDDGTLDDVAAEDAAEEDPRIED